MPDVFMGVLYAVRMASLLTNPDAPRLIREHQERVTRIVDNARQDRHAIARWEDEGGSIQ
jgi:hypothetical protein